MHLTERSQLDGLADNVVESAAEAATAAGLEGWLLTLVLPTIQPAISSLTDRDVRRRLHEAATTRGMRGGEHDTTDLVGEITALRAERAALLGFADHAAYVVDDQTAGTSKAVLGFLDEMAGPAMRNLEGERDRIQELMRADGVEGPVEPWDWAYYAARDLAATYDVDSNALRPYFELQRVLQDGIFFAATRLYGVTFTEREDLPVYADDVRVFEVLDADGSTLGLFVCDWFARPTKRGGAWMDEFVGQSHLLDRRPVVVVCLNVPKPAAGRPALMTTDEVRTAFHEFGHALHGLFSDVVHPRLHGTAVPRDFVEFPSQVNEMWAWWPEVLANYAVHHVTGEPLAQDVVDRLIASAGARPGLRHRRDARGGAARPGVAPAHVRGAGRARRTTSRPSRPGPGAARCRDPAGAAALPQRVLRAHLQRWVRRRLLLLPVERGPGRGPGRLVPRAGRAERGRTGTCSAAGCSSVGGTVDPIGAFTAVRGRAPSTEPLLRRRGLRG